MNGQILNATVAIGISDPEEEKSEWIPTATGVLYARTTRKINGYRGYELYLVTAKHVFQPEGGKPKSMIYLGINSKDKKTTAFMGIETKALQ